MSIKIRKQDTGEIFDLPSDYVIEGEKNNPLFENKGSQTVPIAFPATGHNNRLLDFPFRLDKTFRQVDDLRVIVDTGSFQQQGLLSVNSASKEVLSANIGYDESEMYAQFKDMQLREMPILDEYEFGPEDYTTTDILQHLTSIMKQEIEDDYYVFPVVVKNYDFENESGKHRAWEIINDINAGYSTSTVALGDLKALEERTIARFEGNEQIELSAPRGYGVSPFLKAGVLLDIIFRNYNFTIVENPFREHRQLKKIVVLNNTMDAVLTGKLYYRDLMPDSTIQEFLDGLYAKFGMLYFIESNTKTVRIKFLKDVVTPEGNVSEDFSKFKTEEPTITFSSPKQIRLKMNRELEGAKVLYDTLEEFLEKFNNQFTDSNYNQANSTQEYDNRLHRYSIVNVFKLVTGNTFDRIFSSDFFDWDKKTKGVDYEEIEMKDLCLSFSDYDLLRLLEYTVDFKHSYSDIIIAGETQENIVNPAKLAFAFAWGRQAKSGFSYFFASQFNTDANGNAIADSDGNRYDISLICNREDGLYNRFWKQYDAFIRHSNQEVACRFNLDDLTKLSAKMYETVFLDNQPLLIKQLKYKLNRPDSITECVFRSLRIYKPYDLEREQEIPVYERQKYYWAWQSTETPGRPSGTILLEESFPDGYFTVNGIQIPVSNLSFLPPTEEQYLNNEQRIHKTKKHYVETAIPMDVNTVITTVYLPELIIYND